VYYSLVSAGSAPEHAAHIAIGTSLASILPAAIVSSIAHYRAGNSDFNFIREWSPGITVGVVSAQVAAPYLSGSVLTGTFGLFCLVVAVRFAMPNQFRPILHEIPSGSFRNLAGAGIGMVSGFAGVGGGIMTNIVMLLSGMPMHKSVGRAAAAGVVVGLPATIAAGLGSFSMEGQQIGYINVPLLASIAPAQAAFAWVGAHLAQHIPAEGLIRLFVCILVMTGLIMLQTSLV
jgi:uncharacterized protein